MSENKLIYREGIVSIFVNLLLFGLKLWAGIVSGSVALTADAWHTLSDSVSSMAVIGGAKLSSQAPDKAHPFGHGRWEYIASFVIAIFLGFIAIEFTKGAIENFIAHNAADFGTLAIVVTVISILGKELLAQYAFHIARKTKNSSVKADAWHHRSDALSSVVVLVGIFLKDYLWWIDSALGIIVAIIILHTAYGIVKEAVSKILGEDLKEDEILRIREIINLACSREVMAHHFHLHNYGRHQELTFHIKLESTLTIAEGHMVATKIEKAIEKELGYVSTIHVEELIKE